MRRTSLCDLLGIGHPVLQGGMLWIAGAGLAAAVSNAGGLGVVSPLADMELHGDPVKNFTRQITELGTQTDRPFGVNIPLDLTYAPALIDLAGRLRTPVVITSAGGPGRFTGRLKAGKRTVLHVVSCVKQALKAEAAGVDAVIAEGVEAAAHTGRDELPLFSLLPQVVDAVSLPVIAAGGIVDGRGLAAALCLGAEGVQLGTRFLMTHECTAHNLYKKAVLGAVDTDTLLTGRGFQPTRQLKTPFSTALAALEQSGATAEERAGFIGFRSNRKAQLEGDFAAGEAYCGASAGMITTLLHAEAVVRHITQDAEQILRSARLRERLNPPSTPTPQEGHGF